METPLVRLTRILKENNLQITQNPLQPRSFMDGGFSCDMPTIVPTFIDPTKEVTHEPVQEETTGEVTS